MSRRPFTCIFSIIFIILLHVHVYGLQLKHETASRPRCFCLCSSTFSPCLCRCSRFPNNERCSPFNRLPKSNIQLHRDISDQYLYAWLLSASLCKSTCTSIPPSPLHHWMNSLKINSPLDR